MYFLDSIEYLAKARRSTDSGSKDKDFEERKRIIDKCFSEKTPVLEDIEQRTTEPLAKDKIELHNVDTAERNKSFVSKILDKDERDDVRRNALLQSIAAQVKEVKQAHDINPANNLYAETVAAKSKTVAQVTVNNDISQDTVQIDTTPHLKSKTVKVDVGTPKISALLQNINVQATTENVGDVEKLTHNANIHNEKTDKKPSHINVTSRVSEALESAEFETNVEEEKEKLVQQVIHIDKSPHVDIETDKTGDKNSTSIVAKELESVDLSATKVEIEQEKLTQHVVHIDKNPVVDVDVEKEKIYQNVHINKTPYVDITPDQDVELNTKKISESLGKAEGEASAPKTREEKLSQHIVHVDKTPVINMAKDDSILTSDKNLSDLVDKSTFLATSAKVEEEKLAQKIEKVDETPHVEASVDKIEGFNTSPRILGHQATHTLSAREPSDTTDQPEQVNMDELAKKCLGKPDGKIDEILLKEFKNISRANSIKFDLPKEDSSQKYFSQIFENKSKDNNNIVFDVTNANLKQLLHRGLEGLKHKEKRVDKFDPFHLDTVPIVTPDTRDYDIDNQRNINPDSFKNILLDIPAVLDPSDMQAIPFCQYVSKENIILQELQVDPSSHLKNIQETEIKGPMNEEVILRREEEESSENNEIKEVDESDTKDRSTAVADVKPRSDVDPLSKPSEMSALSESDVSKILEYKHVLSAQQEGFARMSPNIIQGQCPQEGTQDVKQSSIANGEMEVYPLENAANTVLTSTGAPTAPMDPFGNPINMPAEQPKIEHDRQADPPPSTAISAHQDPSEYFPTQHLSISSDFPGIPYIDYEVTDSKVTYTGVFDTKCAGGATTEDTANDNLISQSAYYNSIFPQLAEPEEYSTYRKSNGNLREKDLITQVFVQPQKEDYPEDFIHQESKADTRDKVFQTESTREYIKEQFVQPEQKVHGVQEEFIEPELKYPNIRENIIQPTSTQEDNRKIAKRVDKFEASATKDIEGIPITDETIPLSVLLRRVRERNRLELIKSFKAETEMKNPCLPPLDKSKPKTTLQPKPCQPKPKEETKPPPCKPPQKKDPCAKFIPFFFGIMFSDVSVPPKVNYGQMSTYIFLAKEMAFQKLKRLCQILGIISNNGVEDKLHVACARPFEPWVPIPSWPLPKTEKKRELVCPKDGCKLPVHPVRSNTDKPCLGMPKKISPKKLTNPVVFDEM